MGTLIEFDLRDEFIEPIADEFALFLRCDDFRRIIEKPANFSLELSIIGPLVIGLSADIKEQENFGQLTEPIVDKGPIDIGDILEPGETLQEEVVAGQQYSAVLQQDGKTV
jgi:hypothetical protein